MDMARGDIAASPRGLACVSRTVFRMPTAYSGESLCLVRVLLVS